MSEPMRIIILAEQARARSSLRALLASWALVQEVREAASAEETIRMMEQSLPNLVLVDTRRVRATELKAIEACKARWPTTKVVVLSMYAEAIVDAMAAGADAVVVKSESPDKLLSRLAAVVSKER